MLVMLQSHPGTSDAEAVDLTVMDLRWQMVLDRLGSEEAAFGQGTLVDFRDRLIRSNMDLRLLERTVELARRTDAFDWRKAEDVAGRGGLEPVGGAGRV